MGIGETLPVFLLDRLSILFQQDSARQQLTPYARAIDATAVFEQMNHLDAGGQKFMRHPLPGDPLHQPLLEFLRAPEVQVEHVLRLLILMGQLTVDGFGYFAEVWLNDYRRFHTVNFCRLERGLTRLGLSGDLVAYKYLTSDYFLNWDTADIRPYFEARLPLLEEAVGLHPAPHWLPTDWAWLRRTARARALCLLRTFRNPSEGISGLLAWGSAANRIRQSRPRRSVELRPVGKTSSARGKNSTPELRR